MMTTTLADHETGIDSLSRAAEAAAAPESGPGSDAGGSLLLQLVERPGQAVMARIRQAAWHLLDLDTEFTVLD